MWKRLNTGGHNDNLLVAGVMCLPEGFAFHRTLVSLPQLAVSATGRQNDDPRKQSGALHLGPRVALHLSLICRDSSTLVSFRDNLLAFSKRNNAMTRHFFGK